LQKEFSALSSQITSINTKTKWNGTAVLSAATTKFQVGAASGQTVSVIVSATTLAVLGISGATFTLSGATVASGMANASSAITNLDSALGKINTQRANLGATINRLAYAADNLTNISSNLTASRSTIMDTDYAIATTQLSKTQIIQQAATAMLAQANQQPQSVMALLKG
jgi:flagellin